MIFPLFFKKNNTNEISRFVSVLLANTIVGGGGWKEEEEEEEDNLMESVLIFSGLVSFQESAVCLSL